MIKRPPINYLERKKILGTKIKAIRKSKKLTQPAFGLMINNGQLIDKKTIYEWEKGTYLPIPERLSRIADLGNISLNIDDDSNFSLSNMRYAEDLYSFGLFHRSYVGLDRGKLFGLFNETTLTYLNGTSSFARGEGAEYKRTDTTINELHLGINPGVAVFITQNVCAELSFGVVGFKYRSEKQSNNLGETGKRRTSGADFKINLFNINIGLTLCM